MSAAEMIARSGSKLELVSPERFFAQEMRMNHVPYMRAFQQQGVRVTINTRLVSVAQWQSACCNTWFGPEYHEERLVDQVVVEHGTLPIDDLYRELKPLPRNRDAVDYDRLVNGGAIFPVCAKEGQFDLVRIGDAVHARNIHAAIYDGLRYATRF